MEGSKRFSDFATEHIPLDGDKIKIDAILNKEIEVLAVRVKPSKYKDKGTGACLTIQFMMDGKKYVVFTGSGILAEQAQRYQAEVPFLAAIKKIDKYYTFT
ncbi:MAG: hypothetical protein ABFD76_04950 [Smithella sp.]